MRVSLRGLPFLTSDAAIVPVGCRDRSVATVGFEGTETAELVQTTLDTRVVPIGKGRHKVRALP